MRSTTSTLLGAALLLGPLFAQHGSGDGAPYAPDVKAASSEARETMAGFELREGFRIELVAAEPHLANPVAFCLDARGRIFVAETFRLHAGVTDMRSHMDWLHDELAAQTVADRVAYMRKHEGERFEERYAREHERVRLLVDTDGDGLVDLSTVFADGFREPAAGIAAGLLARGEDLYYACIPALWKLTDADGDGRAEARTQLQTGYGVRTALLGHDLHGLRVGPDGRLYFSVGDRGLHVEQEGKVFAYPDRGCVMRCELDGSGLEIFATGLRNPQELVFDDLGNLFTGDNNSDGGDRARWVYVVKGGDTGWRHYYQYVTRPNSRGPWNAEKVWHPPHPEQPAFVVPPIDNFINGPSGLTYYPGVGFGAGWEGTFFLCEFRGAAGSSGVMSLRNRPRGAGFELVDAERFVWRTLPTDCDFGPDGGLYISDWVAGWGMTGKGRLYRVVPAQLDASERAAMDEVRALLAAGMAGRGTAELRALLAHRHRDVRQEAHLELAARLLDEPPGSLALRTGLGRLLELLRDGDAPRLARVHALWSVWIVGRRRSDLSGIASEVALLSADADPELRAQSLRVLGELGDRRAAESARAALVDDDARVRFFACEALGALGRGAEDTSRLVRVLALDDAQDPWLRHAAVHALERLESVEAVRELSAHESAAVRRAAVVVLRRWEDPAVAGFLDDPEALVREEAARAIYDVPIRAALPALARVMPRGEGSSSGYFERRILNALRVTHDREAASKVMDLARTTGDRRMRREALEILAEWCAPSPVDRLTGFWNPLPAGDSRDVAALAHGQQPGDLDGWDEGDLLAWVTYLERHPDLGVEGLETLPALVADSARAKRASGRALRLLFERGADVSALLPAALTDADGRLRAEAMAIVGESDPAQAVALLDGALAEGPPAARQAAVRVLAGIPGAASEALLVRHFEEQSERPGESVLLVELLEAAAARPGGPLASAVARWEATRADLAPLEQWAMALTGGDARAGREIFLKKTEVNCLRCHKVQREGSSEVGPDLTKVAERLDASELLRSIVEPNAVLAEGYESWMFVDDEARVVVGRILSEDATSLVVLDAEGERHELDPTTLQGRRRDVSSMPADLPTHLSRREMRDLVAFLQGLR